MTKALDDVAILERLERRVLWLSSWTIHHANHLRAKADPLKVGGHQASSASLATLMTALYFRVLNPEDRVAVKPHASPAFHAIQYLLGNQSREALENFRGFEGAQSYPSRTKDKDDVDFSTGSVGLGAAITCFASLTQDYLRTKNLGTRHPEGRMVALVGDAELDEGNIFEALHEGWKQNLRNVWWVIDYNRQSLDAVVREGLYSRIEEIFKAFGWEVVTLKYGKRLEEAFAEPGGERLRQWIDDCPNALYSALTYQGGAAWRKRLLNEIGDQGPVSALIDRRSDDELHRLMTNLAGHDIPTILETFEGIDHDRPICFVAYTIKGYGLPLAGHKDNHAGLMTVEQMAALKKAWGIRDGREWEPFEGLNAEESRAARRYLAKVPFNGRGVRRYGAPYVEVPEALPFKPAQVMSTQDGFGRILNELGREKSELARRIVTSSPDVTVSTNLGPWVNRRGLFSRQPEDDVFRREKIASPQKWGFGPEGQHIELGIAENNLFILMAAMGLSHELFGERLIPIGTLYDPFIQRGLDSLNYACYQHARFILVATPSGVSLAPEGGAHQSVGTPLIGMAQDGLAAFEPAFTDELAAILAWSFDYVQRDGSLEEEQDWLRDETGGSVYLRLSTRPIEQPQRKIDDALKDAIIQGGYWLREPGPATELVIVYQGVVAPEAIAAAGLLAEDRRNVGVLAVTSADRLNAGWHAAERARQRGHIGARSHVETLLVRIPGDAALVTVLDGHPTTLSWLGSVYGHLVRPLGVEHFGQTGTITDLYRHHCIDSQAILQAAQSAAPGRPLRHLRVAG